MRRQGSAPSPHCHGTAWQVMGALAAAFLVVLPLLGQQRPDCVSEEVTGDRFYDVCGSDRQTLEQYGDRVVRAKLLEGVAAIDALRLILCDIVTEDPAVQALVHRDVAYAADDLQTDENTLLALIESGVMPLFQKGGPRRTSAPAVVRLTRVVADRHASVASRCWALELLIEARGNGAATPWINDLSDPIQSCAAQFAVKELSDVARQEVLKHSEHPLYFEVLLNELVTEETLEPLCRAASDAAASPLARVRAI